MKNRYKETLQLLIKQRDFPEFIPGNPGIFWRKDYLIKKYLHHIQCRYYYFYMQLV